MRYITGIKIIAGRIVEMKISMISNGKLVRSGVWTIGYAVQQVNGGVTLKTLHVDTFGNLCFADIGLYGADAIRSILNGIDCDNLLNLPKYKA